MRRKTLLSIALILTVVIAWTTQSFAVGALFSRPLRSEQTYNKMWIKLVDVRVDIQDQIAVTHVDQTFFNEMNTQVEAIYVFPLPQGAVITELVYWFNGVRYVAEVRERQQAVQDYNKKIREYLDPALLQYLGDNLFRLNIAPINALSDVRFEITYTELLPYEFGTISYLFLLNTTALSPRPLQRVSLDMKVKSQSPFKRLSSPSHQTSTATNITKVSDYEYRIVFGDENFFPDKDFILEFETVRQDVDIHVLTYTPTVADSFGTDSFYALWITPPDTISQEEVIPKNIVFTADVSSSMEGLRIQQLKQALDSFLDHLQPYDRFNIVSFGTHVVTFKPDLVAATPDKVNQAREFVRQLSALGLTNIEKALRMSLNQSYQDTTFNAIIFLTDGYPTWGETNIQAIIDTVKSINKKGVHIFPFGVGEDISKSLLEALARENGGYATYITADDSIALVVANHFQRMSRPVMSNLSIDLGGLKAWDAFPKTLPDLFWGNQVLQLGLYSNSGTFDVTLTGKIRGHSYSFSSNVLFSRTVGEGHRFVPRLWAKAKIDYLLEQIAIYGEQEELVNQVIELSIRFGILTPYTAFYADPTTEVVEHTSPTKVKTFVLNQNYPNPFNPETEISYILPQGKASYRVVLKVYDLLGRLIKVLVDEEQTSGLHKVIWDGTDMYGRKVASGVYVYCLEVGDFRQSRKMLLMR